MLEKEFNYYIKHQNELIKQYNDKHIVIVGENVIGAYNSQTEAYDKAIQEYDKGTFLIQYVAPGKSSYTQTYCSRVVS